MTAARRIMGAGSEKRAYIVVSDFLSRIVDGELSEGAALPTEAAIMADYGISRTAVREALQILVAKGFVRVRQGSGATVMPRTSWNVLDPEYLKMTGLDVGLLRDLLESRDIIEPALAALAASRARPSQLERLRELVLSMAATPDLDPVDHAKLDVAFHGLIAEATNNVVLISIHSSITHLGRAQRELMAHHEGGMERALFWHEHLLEAIERRDPGASRDAMRMHMRQVHAELEADSQPSFLDSAMEAE
jgi:DNA-binding FadR family transcriptional regulator